jgi:hypothetical protein
MTKAGKQITEGLQEAVAIAKGEQPAASITVNGFRYVPEVEGNGWLHDTPFITSNSGPDGNKFISVKVRTNEALHVAQDLIINAFKSAGAK